MRQDIPPTPPFAIRPPAPFFQLLIFLSGILSILLILSQFSAEIVIQALVRLEPQCQSPIENKLQAQVQKRRRCDIFIVAQIKD